MNKKLFFYLDYYSEHIYYKIISNRKLRKNFYNTCKFCITLGNFSNGINLRYDTIYNDTIIYFFDDDCYRYSFSINNPNYIERNKLNTIGNLYYINDKNKINKIMDIYNLDYINSKNIYYYENKNNLIIIYKDYDKEYRVHLVYNTNIKKEEINLNDKKIEFNNFNEFRDFINYYYNLDNCLNVFFDDNLKFKKRSYDFS